MNVVLTQMARTAVRILCNALQDLDQLPMEHLALVCIDTSVSSTFQKQKSPKVKEKNIVIQWTTDLIPNNNSVGKLSVCSRVRIIRLCVPLSYQVEKP